MILFLQQLLKGDCCCRLGAPLEGWDLGSAFSPCLPPAEPQIQMYFGILEFRRMLRMSHKSGGSKKSLRIIRNAD